MNEVDELSRRLLDEAKRFFERAKEEAEEEGKTAYLHAALLLGFSSLEAHINAIAEEMATRDDFNVLEKSLLLEKDFKLERGEFILGNQLKMYRLEDRIEFLHKRFSKHGIDRASAWWTNFRTGIELRNRLVHPKGAHAISIDEVQNALLAIVEVLNSTYKAVYKRKFPAVKRGISSKMRF